MSKPKNRPILYVPPPKQLIVPGNAPRPFINRGITIRDDMVFQYGSYRENSPISSVLGYWWGIMIGGKYIWRNEVKLENTEENNIDEKFLKQYAINDATEWLQAVANKLNLFITEEN